MARSRTVVITGATSGIGASIAIAFCKPGTRVFLVGRDERKLAATARKIPVRNLAGTALANLSSVADIRNLIATICGRLRRVDVLVHAAGAYGWTDLGSTQVAGLDALFEVNVRAPYLLTQGLLPLL